MFTVSGYRTTLTHALALALALILWTNAFAVPGRRVHQAMPPSGGTITVAHHTPESESITRTTATTATTPDSKTRSRVGKAYGRKISFGSQSEAGAKTRETWMTVLATLRKRVKHPQQRLKEVLDALARDPAASVAKLLWVADTS